MDGESCYESDISESWSLIDINLNEESLSPTDAQPQLEEPNLPESKDVNLKKSDSIEDFVRQCRESVSDLHRPYHFDFDSSVETQVLESDRKSRKDSVSEDGKEDSESIEILEVDESHRDSELERLDISIIDSQEVKSSTYQTDDEESWEENVDNKIPSISSTVIKRRNLVRHSKSSDNVNSDKPSENSKLNNQCSDEKIEPGATMIQPVYKHYRNNVVNTVLSLSMGVIFAGVACIAIGHFLGVHDATETSLELVDTLKKLQMENVALQSRLSQLNRAVLKRDINSKLELKPQDAISCEERKNFGQSKGKTTNINRAALSEIRSSLKSIQWLTKLENVINDKGGDETEIDFGSVGKYIHDQLTLLNNKKEEGIKVLEDSDRKISKVLQKIIDRLSASQDNIEKLYNRLVDLKDRVNHKVEKITPERSPKKIPVTESDLNSIQWGPVVKNDSPRIIREYKYPQPEEFYQVKNSSDVVETRSKKGKEKEERKVKKEGKRRKKREKGKKNRKVKTEEKIIKKYNEPKVRFGRFNETKENYGKLPKREEKPRKMKKVKNSKNFKILRPNGYRKNKYSRLCSGNECFNLTGYWVFKYADGREEFRRHQTRGDWQFERARGRREQRDEDDVGSWQFKRTLARESGRNDQERYRKNQEFFHEEFSWI